MQEGEEEGPISKSSQEGAAVYTPKVERDGEGSGTFCLSPPRNPLSQSISGPEPGQAPNRFAWWEAPQLSDH